MNRYFQCASEYNFAMSIQFMNWFAMDDVCVCERAHTREKKLKRKNKNGPSSTLFKCILYLQIYVLYYSCSM